MLLRYSPVRLIQTDLYNKVDVSHFEAALDCMTLFVNNENITLQSSNNEITLSEKLAYSVTVTYCMTVAYCVTMVYHKTMASQEAGDLHAVNLI